MHRHITILRSSEHVLLWNNHTGRGMNISHASFDAKKRHHAVQSRLDAFGMNGRPQELSTLIPHRSRWSLLSSYTLIHPIPAQRSSGGYRYQSIPLSEQQQKLWLRIDGKKTLHILANEFELSVRTIHHLLTPLCTYEVQAIQLRNKALGSSHRALLHLHAPLVPQNKRNDHMYDEYGGTTLEQFHSSEILDAYTHFDNVEITLAHALEQPHPSLRMESFGTAIAQTLLPMAHREINDILELGPGTGALAEGWYTHHSPTRYIRMDASLELLRAQEKRLPYTESLSAHAPNIPLPSDTIDLFICNEVIADLRASSIEDPDVQTSIQKYNITLEEEQSWINLGAWKLLESLWKILRPGGMGYISEFGDVYEIPTETIQLNHPEVSIHFGQLEQVAQQIGFQTKLLSLPKLLKMDMDQRWLSKHSYCALRAALHEKKETIAASAWSPKDFPYTQFQGLEWVPMSEPGPAPLPMRIWALLIWKPKA